MGNHGEVQTSAKRCLNSCNLKHYGIRKIATFDEDFKRVDFFGGCGGLGLG